MSYELFTSGAAVRKAGTNRNTTISASGSALDEWYDEAIAVMSNIARIDISGAFASMDAVGKRIVQNIGTSMIAQKIIQYDMSGYTKAEATQMLNILENDIVRGITLIKEDKVRTYLGVD